MRIEFSERQPYMDWRGHNPLIPISLRHAGNDTLTYAMLDSGADSTLLHASLSDDLGFDFRTGVPTEIFGINPGAPIQGFTHSIDVSIGGVPIGVIDVDFSDEIEDDWTDQLIGRSMVFDRLRIGFRQSFAKGWIYLGRDGRSISLAPRA